MFGDHNERQYKILCWPLVLYFHYPHAEKTYARFSKRTPLQTSILNLDIVFKVISLSILFL